ncbi:uncharacterized protein LOC108603087 [Drosophila busckii]|uniref:uncharacterized protein LOC108603087 n=1 Tax=Drosophila busckii TaxID=30019 RepID=UPI00083F2EDF|nr:uncharacterized protein LOC108603087 [Drosophila busckii]
MDKAQSSEEIGKLHTCSSRRVLWQLQDNEEEEVYDSVVNYRRLPTTDKTANSASSSASDTAAATAADASTSSSKWRLLLKPQAVEESPNLALRYKPSHESVPAPAPAQFTNKRARSIEHWQHLFELIRSNKTSATLGARYKPSHESLKHQASKEQVTNAPMPTPTPTPKPKVITADLRVEQCIFPPLQTVVIREMPPKFARRRRIPDDTDSCGSEFCDLCMPLKQSLHAELAKVTLMPVINPPAKNDNPKSKRRFTKQPANPTDATGSGAKSTSSSAVNPLPTLRQRQLELHRYRLLIEKRRLELLDLKITRERAEAVRQDVLFHKDLQLKHNQIQSLEDANSSQA